MCLKSNHVGILNRFSLCFSDLSESDDDDDDDVEKDFLKKDDQSRSKFLKDDVSSLDMP